MEVNYEDDFDFEEDVDDPEEANVSNETVESTSLSRGSSFASNQPSPRRTVRRAKASKNIKEPDPFKVPLPKIFGKCSVCHKGLKTETGLTNHMKAHKWQEAAIRTPSINDVVEHCKGMCLNIIQEFLRDNIKHDGRYGKDYSLCLKAMECNSEASSWSVYADAVCGVIASGLSGEKGKIVMPSAIAHHLRKAISSNYASEEFRKNILDSSKQMCGCDNSAVWVITLDLLRRLADATLIFVCQRIRGTSESVYDIQKKMILASKGDASHSLPTHVVHYVAGSVLRTHVRLAKRHKKNKAIQERLNCILSKFATIGSPAVQERKSPAYWTYLMSRKSLLFVKESALPFFLELAKLLFLLERPDGVMGHDHVMQAVSTNSHLILMWDSIVGNSLPPDASFSFMVKVVRGMTNTYGRGLKLKRMNLASQKGSKNKTTASVGQRALLL